MIRAILVSLIILGFNSGCATVAINRVKTYYYDLNALDADKHNIAIKALEIIKHDVGCIDFKPLENKVVAQDKIIVFVSLRYLSENYVGIQDEEARQHIIFVTNYSVSGNKLTALEQSYILKVMLHELAHALGMPSQHPFDRSTSSENQLSPQISYTSPAKLSKEDVRYLSSLVCGLL